MTDRQIDRRTHWLTGRLHFQKCFRRKCVRGKLGGWAQAWAGQILSLVGQYSGTELTEPAFSVEIFLSVFFHKKDIQRRRHRPIKILIRNDYRRSQSRTGC